MQWQSRMLAVGGWTLVAVVGCTASQVNTDRRALTLIVAGDHDVTAQVGTALAHTDDLPVRIQQAEFPRAGTDVPSFAEISEALSRARRGYIDADPAACLSEVGDDTQLTNLLVAGRRDLCARYLFWRVACHVASGSDAEAAREARRLAVFGLEIPADVESAAPDVEAVISAALRSVADMHRTDVRLSSAWPGSSFSIDGRRSVCGSPCAVDLPPGDHLVQLTADGAIPSIATVRVEGPRTERVFTTSQASAAVAAEQWSQRYAGTQLVDSASSLRLLAQAVRAQDLVYMSVDSSTHGARLQGAYTVDGSIRATSERVAATESMNAEARGLLKDLLVRGGTLVERPIYQSPWFWAAIAGAAVTAAVVVGVAASPVPVQTQLEF